MSRVYSSETDIDVDLRMLFSSLLQNWQRIVVVALLVSCLAYLFATLVTPKYRAETRILIETRESVFTRPDGDRSGDRPILDEEGVTSQVEVIGSTDLLKKVALKLDLASREEFDATSSMSAITNGLVVLGLKADPIEIPPEERVLKMFREKLSVYRVKNSRVIVIEFSSEDPKLAAQVTNTIAESYIAIQRDAKLQSDADATAWLEPEIADLRDRVKKAEGRVAAFRAETGLLIGRDNSVLATQQLAELSSELSRVRAARASAEAKAASVKNALQSGVALDTVPDVLSSELIQRLRERQAELTAEIADLSTTLLSGHPRIKALRSQKAGLERQIQSEARKVLKGLETEARTSRFRERELLASLNEMKAESAQAGDKEVELRALEREAAAQRDLLESYLTRFREASSRKDGNYRPVDARIFSRATTPAEPYFPKKVPIVAAAFFATLLVMALVILAQELFSGRAMRRRTDGPVEPVREVEMEPAVEPAAAAQDEDLAIPVETGVEDTTQDEVAQDTQPESETMERSQQIDHEEPSEHAIEPVAEQLITSGATRAIIVSPEGDEAAAAAVLLAREIADNGLRVLLLDLTESGAAGSPMVDGARLPGITNLLASTAQFGDVIHADLYSDCHVIPNGTANPERAMRAIERLPIIMDSLSTAYDLVIVECGPTDADGIQRIMGEGARLLLSVLEPEDETVFDAAADLHEAGHEDIILVTPVGHHMPRSPEPDRSVA